MCEPVSATIAIISGVTSVAGGFLQADAAKRQGAAEQELANLNAGLLMQQGADARMRGATDAGLMRWGTTKTIAQQRALAGASGLAMDSGSTLGLHEDTRFIGEIDAATLTANAAREAWGFETQATILRKRGQQALDAANAAATGYMLGGFLDAAKAGAGAFSNLPSAPKRSAAATDTDALASRVLRAGTSLYPSR